MRQMVAITVTAFVVCSCNNENQLWKMDTTKKEKLVKQYFEYFNSPKLEKMVEMYAETADFKDPSLGKRVVKLTRQ